MKLLNIFKRANTGTFISEEQFLNNLQSQKSMSPQTLTQLYTHGVSEDKELKLEFFFYTNTAEKAQTLAEELQSLSYTDVNYDKSASDNSIYVVNGWTTKMRMDEGTIVEWSNDMVKIGYKHDADFDGWGTMPDQE